MKSISIKRMVWVYFGLAVIGILLCKCEGDSINTENKKESIDKDMYIYDKGKPISDSEVFYLYINEKFDSIIYGDWSLNSPLKKGLYAAALADVGKIAEAWNNIPLRDSMKFIYGFNSDHKLPGLCIDDNQLRLSSYCYYAFIRYGFQLRDTGTCLFDLVHELCKVDTTNPFINISSAILSKYILTEKQRLDIVRKYEARYPTWTALKDLEALFLMYVSTRDYESALKIRKALLSQGYKVQRQKEFIKCLDVLVKHPEKTIEYVGIVADLEKKYYLPKYYYRVSIQY